MRSLVLGVLLCALPSMLNAACFMTQTTGKTHCWDSADKTWYAAGYNWRNRDCMECSCISRPSKNIKSEMSCCHAYPTGITIPDDCVSEFDQKTCKHIIHKKDDPSTECGIISAVG
ncbi:beta-microseminoprotein-like [Osmerus eperlanus]|uniref:beta-microseminoprotein-like n=1 Tax=Osmerus eperlanus TaxID=29151 RepID=UPI002E0FDF16